MERNVKFDLMKGGGKLILMDDMGIGALHMLFKSKFCFHNALILIISGYLYKERPIMDIIRRNTKKVLVPYIVTGG